MQIVDVISGQGTPCTLEVLDAPRSRVAAINGARGWPERLLSMDLLMARL